MSQLSLQGNNREASIGDPEEIITYRLDHVIETLHNIS